MKFNKLGLLVIIICLISIPFLFTRRLNNYELGVIVMIILITLIYFTLIIDIKIQSKKSLFADGRFYFYTFFYIYSIWTPILALLYDIDKNGFNPLRLTSGTTHTSEQLFLTTLTTLLMIVGMRVGFLLINKQMGIRKYDPFENFNPRRKQYKFWLIVSLISILLFLLPFFNGGFDVLKSGGTILEVSKFRSNSFWITIMQFFFSAEVMTFSTVMFLLCFMKENINVKIKVLVVLSTILVHGFIAVRTTRTARFIIILVVIYSFISGLYSNKEKKYYNFITKIIPICFVLIYFIDMITSNNTVLVSTDNKLIDMMLKFDGIGPYDALFRAVNEDSNLKMLFNIPYSLFRPLPIIGKIVEFFGFNQPPLYSWMASQYPDIYTVGGGLAYMPQIEAYLSGGYIACLIFGIIYGLVFGKVRSAVGNVVIICMAILVARGSLGILSSLLIPYVLLGYLLYYRVLARISFKTRKKQ